jgi:hypothetical protein
MAHRGQATGVVAVRRGNASPHARVGVRTADSSPWTFWSHVCVRVTQVCVCVCVCVCVYVCVCVALACVPQSDLSEDT